MTAGSTANWRATGATRTALGGDACPGLLLRPRLRMSPVPTRSSVALTLTVAFTTLCALALPDGMDGRDSVVRLARGGLQRVRCADTACCDHDTSETCAVSAGRPERVADRFDDTDASAIQTVRPVLGGPDWREVTPARFAREVRPPAPPGHPVSGRAPPAR